MEVICRASFGLVAALVILLASAGASSAGLAPAPAPATSDGASIDQAIACVLMLVALLLTYIIH